MAKILMINLPYAGHTNPTLPLAAALVKAGHTVDYVNAPHWEDAIKSTGANFVPYIEYSAPKGSQEEKRACISAAFKTAQQLPQKYDLLIYEMLFFAGKILADELGIPCIRQFSQLAWNREMKNAMQSQNKLFLLSSKLISRLMLPPAKARALGIRPSTIAQSVLDDKPDANIVYVPKDIQPRSETFDDSFYFINPQERCSTPSLQNKSSKNPSLPIVYISLGSIIQSTSFYKKCFQAFDNKNMVVHLVIGKTKKEKLGSVPANFKIYSFAPQKKLLQQADVFITHAGMNSLNEAIVYKVPMLALPILNDQYINANQIASLHLGKKQSFWRVTSEKLYKNTMELIENAEYKDNFARLNTGNQLSDCVKACNTIVEKYASRG